MNKYISGSSNFKSEMVAGAVAQGIFEFVSGANEPYRDSLQMQTGSRLDYSQDYFESRLPDKKGHL